MAIRRQDCVRVAACDTGRCCDFCSEEDFLPVEIVSLACIQRFDAEAVGEMKKRMPCDGKGFAGIQLTDNDSRVRQDG
jgi:hypothetical protein